MLKGDGGNKLIAVDLFCGGGGLTLGLKQAGFIVSAAVETEAVACATYAANHNNTVLFRSDVRLVSGEELVRTSPTGKIDLVAACPPCQGFSSLTSKYRREDARNELIFEFVRLVEEIRPKALMMENVPGLAKKGAELLGMAIERLEQLGYFISQSTLNVADYGVPQSRRRLVILGGLDSNIPIPLRTHGSSPHLKPWVTVRDAISNHERPIKLKDSFLSGGPEEAGWNIVRDVATITLQRLRATKAGSSRYELPLPLRPTCHKTSNSGFSNVYGRMSWDEPSPTITGGCTTLSKGRFGHPSLLRTISVREAALLQTFPKDYRFKSSYMDKVCNVVGNALPPVFAKAMALACKRNLQGE